MAGPSAAILLPDRWTASDVELLRTRLAEALTNETGAWWLLREPSRLRWQVMSPDTGPMLVKPGDWDAQDPEEAPCLARAVGFWPATEIVLVSATNGLDDHRFLAHLAVAVARRYGGLIDLTGPLPVPPAPGVCAPNGLESGAGTEQWARSRETLATLGGAWHEIPYVTARGARYLPRCRPQSPDHLAYASTFPHGEVAPHTVVRFIGMVERTPLG